MNDGQPLGLRLSWMCLARWHGGGDMVRLLDSFVCNLRYLDVFRDTLKP